MKPSLSALILSLSATWGSQALASDPKFQPVDIPKHIYSGGWEHFVGGGVATFDCDGDDLPELYVAGGEIPAQLLRNRSEGAISFHANTPKALSLTSVIGAYPLDIDGDGNLDLVVLRAGEDRVLRGLGDCTFAPFETLNFKSDTHWSTAFSATWEAGQSLPTLAIGTYVDRDDPDGPFEACDATLLYRPNGDIYQTPTRLEPGYCALSMLLSDWSRTGRADLRISNDRHYYVRGGQEQLWAMEDIPRLYSAKDGWKPYALWGMGIASRDLTGDGFPEVYLTSMGDQKLQYFDPSSGGPVWNDATYARGTTAHRPHIGDDGRPSTGWHAQFGDVNNDGLDDLFVAKGNVDQMPDAAMQDPNSLLMQQADGRFVEMGYTAGIASMARSRGGALADLNGDGLLDLVVVNRRASMEVYQNVTKTQNWLKLALSQTGPNTHAIGSFIELQHPKGTITRELTVGGGHASGTALTEHFGLGGLSDITLRVIWPDGETTAWQTVEANQHITITR